MKLLARPAPEPTEALLGYLLRLTEANGYPSITYLFDLMPGAYYRGSVGRMDAAPLADIAQLNEEQVAKLTLRPIASLNHMFGYMGWIYLATLRTLVGVNSVLNASRRVPYSRLFGR